MVRAPATGAQASVMRERRRPVDRRRRLRRQDQHPALAARTRLPGGRAAAQGDVGRRRGGEGRRARAVERPWRPRGARRARAACEARARQDPSAWHLPGPPDPRPCCRRDHLTPQVRPPRRQPPGEGPRVWPGPHHEPEPRVSGRRRLAAQGRLLRRSAQPQRRIGRGARPSHPSGLQRAVPPRRVPWAAGQPVPLRPLRQDNARTQARHGAAGEKAEDVVALRQLVIEMGEPVPFSRVCESVEEAEQFASEVGLPFVIRPAYTLGGTGGGFVTTPSELHTIAERGLAASPIRQVLIERSLWGWKEIEYEVMRDAADTCITVCNMENLDPMGVHTGDSIVVAPAQTLSDRDHQMLRSSAIRIIRALGIEGGCNVQFALDPKSSTYFVIEVNPRVSRSSALASKATGYPIARVAAKVAVGRRLDEIPNEVTGRTFAAFEPALDYCVVTIPRWPFDKFPAGDRLVRTQQSATREVN